MVAEEQGGVVAEEVRRDGSDGEHCYSDHAAGLYADVRLHYSRDTAIPFLVLFFEEKSSAQLLDCGG